MNSNDILQLVRDTYIYGYPIVGMYELLFRQVISPETAVTSFHEFDHIKSLATPKTTFIPAPNNDTVYSRAWLDLREQPIIIDTPDTMDRYYTIQLLDMHSETISNIGKRVHGTATHKLAVVGLGWEGELPEDTLPIYSNTTFVLAFLRILVDSSEDLPEVHTLQKHFKIYPLHKQSRLLPKETLPDFRNNTARQFFTTLQKILDVTPILEIETDVYQKLTLIASLPDEVVAEGASLAQKDIDEGGMAFGEEVNHWRIARTKIGNYGFDYLQRAVVWHKGALANVPEESLYPSTFADADGRQLDGKNRYRLYFTKEQLPPVSQFWSLTMYIFRNALLTPNPISRYSIGDRTEGLAYGDDGSLTIYIQSEKPSGKVRIANWLPAPAEPFYMSLRLYGPGKNALNGQWVPPSVTLAEDTLQTQ